MSAPLVYNFTSSSFCRWKPGKTRQLIWKVSAIPLASKEWIKNYIFAQELIIINLWLVQANLGIISDCYSKINKMLHVLTYNFAQAQFFFHSFISKSFVSYHFCWKKCISSLQVFRGKFELHRLRCKYGACKRQFLFSVSFTCPVFPISKT
jgi:hypothetical protein